MTFEFDAAFWATISLFVFLAVVIYLKVPGMIGKALDGRIKAIEGELAEAERLRQEAKFLLEEYEAKRQAATSEAESIVAAAREEAFRLTAEAKTSLEALITRRAKAVEDKIAQAESQAVAEVRTVAGIVDGWKEHFSQCGVTQGDIDLYAQHIDRPFLKGQRDEVRR